MKAEIHAWEKTLINPSLPTSSALKARVAALEAEVARLTAELAARAVTGSGTTQCACCGAVGQWTNSVEDAIDPDGETPVEAPEVPLCDACAEPPQSGGPTMDEVWRRLAARRESRADPHPAEAEQPAPTGEGEGR